MIKLDPQIKINTLIADYPQVIDYLVNEYQFHCIGCFVSEYETLEAGARVHGITGADFDQMLADLTKLVNQDSASITVTDQRPSKSYKTVAIYLPSIYLHGTGVTDFVTMFAAIQTQHQVYPEVYIDTFNQLLTSYYIDELKQTDLWQMINERHNLAIDSTHNWFGEHYQPRKSKLVQTYIDQLRLRGKRVIGIIDLGYDQAVILNQQQLISGFSELYVSGEIGSGTRDSYFWQRLVAMENDIDQVLFVSSIKRLQNLAQEQGIDTLLIRKSDNVIAKLEERLHIVS
jgi:hybrid cluster-associated redox disulfide protein